MIPGLDVWATPMLDFVRTHADWVWPAVFFVAFCESLVLLSLLVPGTAILLAVSTLIPSGAVEPWPLVAAATTGATAGDAVSYGLGRYCRGLTSRWPLNRYPGGVEAGLAFFHRHGGKSVFIGRFFGPLRAFVPLAAGMSGMRPGPFWAASILSAIIWAPTLVLGGNAVGFLAERLAHWPPEALAALAAAAAGLFVLWRRRQKGQNLIP